MTGNDTERRAAEAAAEAAAQEALDAARVAEAAAETAAPGAGPDAAAQAAAEAAAADGLPETDTPLPDPEDPAAAEIEALTAERDALRDQLLRALADLENTRKRAERDRKDAEAYGGTKLARDMLDVYDNLGRAVAATDDAARAAAGPVIEGIELTRQTLLQAFAKHRIEPVSPEPGEKFDAQLHQAMYEAPVPHIRPGRVVQVMTEGFTISGRLLRPAQVGVAAEGSGSAAPAEEKAEG